ncbi:threonine ammonia-lyase [Segnochrobactraceae bacterium EtOH-i3]
MTADKVDLDAVRAARQAIAGQVIETPCLPSRTLSALIGADVALKFENLQFTASFKERGALNKLLSLTPEERARGVVAASAGNHAQGVAYHALRLGIRATIIMPATAPAVKVGRVRAFGADVILHGDTFADAAALLPAFIAEHGATLIHPFDDPQVIAGQGTIALEMLEAMPDLEVLAVPVGGGGLISGVAVAAKALKPSIRVIGVQSERFRGMAQGLGKTGPGAGGASIAEGIAVSTAGALTTAIARELVDDILIVEEEAIEDAIAMLLEIEKSLCEGAGAAGLAAMVAHPHAFRDRRTGVVLSGGNIDMSVLSAVLQRAQVRRGLMFRLIVNTPDMMGALARIADVIARAGGNIRQVVHDRVFDNASAKAASVSFDVEVQDASAQKAMITGITALGMDVRVEP